MKEFIKKKLIRWGLKKPDFYSYYIGSRHCEEFDKKDTDQHRKFGVCERCGYWQKVDYFEGIPEELRKIKGAWRKHI